MSANKKLSPWIVVTGLDGAGQKTLIKGLVQFSPKNTFNFHLPYSEFVLPSLKISGGGKPMSDSQTDRLIFALDARLTNYRIAEWRKKHPVVISKRSWTDNFFHGMVQGFSYAQINNLLQVDDLQKPSAVIYLVSKTEVAYQRIKNDPYKDKYEILSYMKEQHRAINSFYRDVETRNKELKFFFDIPNVLIDTTTLTILQVFNQAKIFLLKYLSF